MYNIYKRKEKIMKKKIKKEEILKIFQKFEAEHQECKAQAQQAQSGEAAGESNNSGANDVEDAEVVD